MVVLICTNAVNSLQVKDDEADDSNNLVFPSVLDSSQDEGTLV